MAVITLNSNNFEQEVMESNIPVMIDFWASWCGPCKMFAPIIDQLGAEVTNAKIGKVNVDDETQLAQKYGIMSIPTVVIIKDGKVLEKIVGMRSKDELIKLLNK